MFIKDSCEEQSECVHLLYKEQLRTFADNSAKTCSATCHGLHVSCDLILNC